MPTTFMFRVLMMLIWLSAMVPLQITASHLIVGECSYQHLGNYSYKITITYYRDCRPPSQGGANPSALYVDDPVFVTIYQGSNFYSFDSVYLNSTVTLPDGMSQYCLLSQNPYCINKATFTFNTYLPPGNQAYTIMSQRCCMQEGISNVPNSGKLGYTFYATIPSANSIPSNNSAVFKPVKNIFFCVGEKYLIDHSAIDTDGDSLSYELCSTELGGSENDPKPMLTSGTLPSLSPIPFVAPYSASLPMNGISIHPQTGLLSLQSPIQGSFLTTICCHEWRGGVLINTTKRTYVYSFSNCNFSVRTMINCDSKISKASGGNICNAYCGSRTVEFKNNSIGAISQIWDFGVPGINTDTSSSFEPTYTFTDTGSYHVRLVSQGINCTDTMFAAVNIYDDIVHSDFSYTGQLCLGDSIQFTDHSTSQNDQISHWMWAEGTNGKSPFSYSQHPGFAFLQSGNIPIYLTAFNSHWCYDQSFKVLNISSLPVKAYSDTIVYLNDTVTIYATGADHYTWTSDGQNPINAAGSFQTIVCQNPGSTSYYVLGRDSSGCIGLDTVTIHVIDGYKPEINVFVPNAFTPNGDGRNDEVGIFSIGYLLKSFSIFNRRGQRVFHTTDSRNRWDGKFKNSMLGIDTYYWVALLKNEYNQVEVFKGDIILLR